MPPEGQVYDSNLPAPILGGFFGEYDQATRFVAPLVTREVRRDLYSRTRWTHPYVFDQAGNLRPLVVTGTATFPARGRLRVAHHARAVTSGPPGGPGLRLALVG